MNKPYLIVVTGRPGAGKTTLAEKMSREWYLPLVSRDRIKEGYVHTAGCAHDELPPDANLIATQTFFSTLEFLLDRGISVVAEAAFQHPLWQSSLEKLADKAQIRMMICTVDAQLALDRFLQRGLSDDRRGYFHGDKGVQMLKSGVTPVPGAYAEPQLDCPTLHVDTSGAYSPDMESIRRWVFGSGN